MRAESSEQVTIFLPVDLGSRKSALGDGAGNGESKRTVGGEATAGDGGDVTGENVKSVSGGH